MSFLPRSHRKTRNEGADRSARPAAETTGFVRFLNASVEHEEDGSERGPLLIQPMKLIEDRNAPTNVVTWLPLEFG